MRTKLELLKVLRDNTKHFRTGLCGYIDYLRYIDIITDEESVQLLHYLTSINIKRTGYYWTTISYWDMAATSDENSPNVIANLKPRLEWINNQIKTLES